MNKNFLTRIISFVLAAMMILTSLPINTFAEADEPNTGNTEKKTMNYDKTPIGKEQINGDLEVKVAKPADGKTAKELVKNPDMPKLYTLRADYKVQRGDNEIISYQPYIVTVGDYDYKYTDQKGVEQKVLSDAEKAKINKYIDLPELDGYSAPTPRFHVNYKYIKDNAEQKNGEHPYVYNPKPRDITVRHVFQHLDDIEKYGGEGATKEDIVEVQSGLTGAILNIQALDDDKIQGYEPESNTITTQVPESNAEFEVVFRYNRKHYNLVYDTKEGTPIPSRTVYFEQVLPALADVEIPKKIGAKLVGWKPSKDIEGSINNVNKIYKAGEVIKDNDENPVLDLKANLKMPASDITFTAVWKDKEKADYAVQFWAEKADHAGEYDYIGTHVYKNQDTGMRPDLNNEPVKDVVFPDLDQARLKKIWANARFNRGRDLYLNKFYVYNKDLTHKQNKDPDNVNLVKPVEATGKTVYNIYYDRQEYDLYFTKSNQLPAENTFYPEICGYDEAQGEVVRKGGPGNLYHYKARFNQLMLGWPNDAMQTKGFSEGMQSFGWGPNYNRPNWPTHLDTPPYRLNADEFLDMENYDKWGGYTKTIDKGDGSSIDLEWYDYKILSFGIKQAEGSMPHHMDFWMDGFKKDEPIIRYDLYRYKADTNSDTYAPSYPKVQGFTGKNTNETPEYLDSDGIDDKNDERADVTPFPAKTYTDMYGARPVGKMKFIKAFFNNADDWGDPDGWDGFDKNGYLKFEYTRNKYPLRFNYDPSKIKGDSEFGKTNSLDTFYEFPLKVLSPDLVDDDTEKEDREYFKKDPKNFLDNPENLKELGLKDIVENDADGKLRVKRPKGLSDQMVFKGWALDPAGTKLIWENPGEKMPNHPVNLYAKWGEPDYKWKVTFDPNGGELQMIDLEKLTAKKKTIQEGDIGQEEKKTYPERGYKGKELPDEKDADKEKKPQVFTVIQRQKLIEPKIPKREGYDFMGWEFVRYKKNDKGEYTDTVDTSYRDTYKVPELYSFGNDVVSDVHLKAIWVKNNVLDIKAYHHFLNLTFDKEDKVVEQRLPNRRAGSYTAAVGSMQGTDYLLISTKDELRKLEDKSESYRNYKELTSTLNPVGRTNTYTQVLRIEPTEIKNPTTGKYEANPEAKVNVFHFYYRPFRKREYTVNYIDERGKEEIEKFFRDLKLEDINNLEKLRELSENENFKKLTEEEQKEEIEKFFRDLKLEDINNLKELRELLEDEEFKKLTEEEQEEKKEEVILDAIKRNKTKFEDKKKKADFEKIIKKYQVIGPEVVINGNRDYDARNYRKIAGWKLTSDPQQQLFFNVGKDNEFLGINGTGADQVFFYYKDVRVIEVPKDGVTPEDYVRVIFKADKGGSFGKDEKGNDIKELHYDVIKGLKSQLLPIPKELGTKADGTPNDKVEGKYYITPETGKKFTKWDKSPLLNKDTIINEAYTFTAYFDWEGLSATGLVRTEAFKDPDGTWTNDFAPTIDQLKKQLVWREKDEVKDFPEGTVIKLYDEVGAELTTDDQVYDLVNEKKAADKDELVRTINVKAKVTFKDGKEPQELDIPIIVYKNVYEALNEKGDKPLFLSEAEKKEAKDGGLKDILKENTEKRYIKVTVKPNKDFDNKDDKVYYVNPNAWVEIPEIKTDGDSNFTNWTANIGAQNEEGRENGIFNFGKRHKFTEDTIITPVGAGDVVEQTDPNKKPPVPDSYVKVIVDKTDNAELKTDEKQTQTFWVNPAKEVVIPVTKPTGKDVPVSNDNPKAFTWVFTKWTSDETPSRSWSENIDSGIRAKFDKETRITANYDKSIHDQGTVVAEKIEAYESTKGINDFIPTEDALKAQVKVIDANGTAAKLPSDAKVELVLGDKSQNEKYASLEEELYDKLKEKDNANDEPTRIEKVKAKVTFANGEVQEVEIPIKVIKNIYEAKTLAEKPYYVPKEYVRVVLNPTSLATDPQKTYFYVNPQAKVVIPGNNPKGVGDSKFIKWTMKADSASGNGADYTLSARHQFTEASTITAQYSADVVPQEGTTKPEGVPDNFVEVKFVPTNKAQDTTEKIYWVNPAVDVKIPIEDPKGTQYYTFKEWKIGDVTTGATYDPTKPKKFTDALTTITATYDESKNIISYDPSETDPMARPKGYVRVTFAADEGLKLTEQKAYYVKKNAGIKLGNADLVKPKYDVETGYKFDKWDKEDTLEIKTEDIVVTAKATVLNPVIPQKDPSGKDKPDEYVTVTFVSDANGEIRDNGTKIDKKVYYVNPKKFVQLKAPTPVGNTGYDFSTWKSDQVTGDFSLANYINYTKDTVITAMFNQKDAVYPKLAGSTKPDGYVEVTFVISGQGGNIADGETITYYVDPTRQVSLKAPKTIAGTGFMFDKWRLGRNPTDQIIKPAEKRQYTNNTTIYGSFVQLKDIIPATNDDGTPNLQPVDYVAVLFIGGEHAQKIDGKTIYYVNPNAGKTLGDITKPIVTPDTGWKQKDDPDAWDVNDSTPIKDYIFVVAQYEAIDDVVPALKDDGTANDKPAGYVTVTFKAGNNGNIQENGANIAEKVYYVNPAKYVKLDAPGTAPKTGYVFGSWNSDKKVFSLDNYIRYEHDTTITANFNLENKVIPKTKPDGTENAKPAEFVTVNFIIDGQGGQFEANQVITYFVKKGEAVTIHPPKTKANTGYEFEKWDKDTTTPTPYNADVTTVKGSFKKLDDIIKSKKPDGTVNAKPEGYVTVQFLKGEHGVLDGKTTFYVNPEAGKKLEDLDTKGITVVPSPTYKFSNWDKPDTTVIDKNIVVIAEYTQLPNIIKAGPKDTAPAGYVVIIFETDGRGKITGNKAYEDPNNPAKNETEIVYFVNPKKNIKLAKLEAGATPKADQLAIPSTTPDDANKYEFGQWRADIDTTTPITRGRVHIAMFKPKQVTLTYKAEGEGITGKVPPALTVDYNTNVRLAGKGDLAKKDASFKGWKIGEKIYQAGDPINLKEDTTAYAQWTNDQNIIPYDPVNKPTTRPDDTYVRVTFAVEDGLKLKEQKAYYVKKDAHITLGDAKLAKPGYDIKTGYKFDTWDKEDTLVITEDILVTAKATKLDTAIPETKKDGTPNEKPTGYKEVTFVIKTGDEAKGSIDGVAKFYVNPTEYVTINPPATKANTGFEFGAWDKDATIPTVYKEDATITGSFNGLKDVIPKTKTDDSEKPDGYKTVTFVIDPATGGQIVYKEVTVYYVNPAKEVTVPQPKTLAETGYKFDKWKIGDQEFPTEAKKYTENTIVKGNFKKLDDIIPSTDDKGKLNAKPDGYVTVTFDKGEHGKEITGQTVYYVNPTAVPVKTLANIKKPEVKAETGYKFKSWNFADTKEILSDITVIAQYDPIDDVVPKTKDDESDKPEGYITVSFVKGEHGKELTGQAVYYVNPNKSVVLEEKAPTPVPNKGYTFARWDTSIDKAIQYKDGDKITALYNEPENISETEVAGYVKVEFKPGNNGLLSGTINYWVKPGVEVNIPAPTVKPNVGYKFDKWDKQLTVNLKANDPTYEITAEYEDLGNIIPQKNTDGSDKPDGYITITFKAVNGSLEGTRTYYVKSNIDVDLTDTANAIGKKADVGYTVEGGKWDKELKDKFKDGDVITFNFKALDDVIPKVNPQGGENKIPDGYVTVKFIPTANAQDPTEKVYYVNPLKENVTIPVNDPVGKEVTDQSGTKYTFNFKLWTVTRGSVATWNKGTQVSGRFIQDTDITAKYNVEYKELIKGPVPKDNVVTGKGDVPNPEDLIKNKFDKDDPNNPNNLPDGTRITYEKEPKVDEVGNVTAKVKVEYPGGATTIVEVPITVVDNVVPQIGGEDGQKPLVPDSYVKVKVDTTEKATLNTRFVKVFWVKPGVEVTLPDILAPTGRTVTDLTTQVTNTNNFIKWQLEGSNPPKFYEKEIMDTFTENSVIVAIYEFNDNIEPQPKNNQLIPKGSERNPKDFINNPYNDNCLLYTSDAADDSPPV